MRVIACDILRIIREFYVQDEPLKRSMRWSILRSIERESGDVEDAPIMAGQSVGLIHDVPTCKELLDRMAAEAEQEITKFYKAIRI